MTRIGIFGGGQLAQMLTQAAISLGVETTIFEREADSPAGRLTQQEIIGQWDDPAALERFAAASEVITLENEFVDAAILADLESRGLAVYPTSATLAIVQDKLHQKEALREAGLDVPAFRAVTTPGDVLAAASQLGWPLVLKSRRNGYDGYGNATVRHPDDLAAAWDRLARRGSHLMIEAFVPFERELAVMVVRGLNGEIRHYPVVETIQRDHICHVVRAPAAIPDAITSQAITLAVEAVQAVNGIGIFGVELFQGQDDRVLINEIAPRPHNSGHYTIEGCVTSQFENHLRAILGWPLGSCDLRAPAAVMVNLLGRRDGPLPQDALKEALAIPAAHIHLYGKRSSRPGRKLGHVTALGRTVGEAEAVARKAADRVEL